MTAPHPLLARLDASLADVGHSLSQTRFWDVLGTDAKAPVALFDAHTGRRYPPAQALEAFLQQHPFLHLVDAEGRWQATLHCATRLLWNHSAAAGNKSYDRIQAQAVLAQARWAGLEGWKLPNKDQLWAFATATGNPHRQGSEYCLARPDGGYGCGWLTTDGQCDVRNGNWNVKPDWGGYLFACHPHWQEADRRQMLADLAAWGFVLQSPTGNARFPPVPEPMSLEPLALLRTLSERGERLVADQRQLAPGAHPALAVLGELDWRPSRLPRLEAAQLADPHQGLWELWGAPAERLKDWRLVARDPARDLKHHPVAIDFGTSSTVVAIDDGQRIQLLRVGARDFYAPQEPQHYENPTVIECLDFEAFRREWQRTAYRPAHDWDWLRAGHEAHAAWRDNPADTQVLGAILPKMKQWAQRGANAPRLRLFDRKSGQEIEIPPLEDRRPVRGQPLQVSPADPFDPIEFYAFQLGMTINWRKRGLFTRYYLTFPVKYERAVKDRVLASFARGLQRSLPSTLVEQGSVLQEFTVEELASEPAAYAAAALRQLQLEPTEAGLPYAVFDFGGGTADFDYGLWRWANAEEEDLGYEEVFEHLASSGDNFLGGENLLENLAFRVFCANLDVLRAARIHFTKPLDASAPSAAEAFIQPTQAAQTNMVMLMTRLRPFWEGEDAKLESQIGLDLLDADGAKRRVELALAADELDAYLRERIKEGARLFLRELQRAFAKVTFDGPIHLLLAGNASRSRHVRAIFDPQGELWPALLQEVFGDTAPQLEIHPPLPLDPRNPDAPTAKTGVALGLLRLAPGRKVKVNNAVRTSHGDEAPFRYFVGRLRRGVFQAALTPESDYRVWHELGPIVQRVFDLRYTLSQRARETMREGDPELYARPLPWPEAHDGARLWARAIAPQTIEICCLAAGQTPQDDTSAQRLDLTIG
ncbi:hypothetical protein [Azonexus hydrophilus]|uniref:hypothetical protein n=1 Tax=Azonexus hydrophilus TaxID=418702 RepID=UPI0024915622|nr:hypothetical protein [Azonexus hydrophilus]